MGVRRVMVVVGVLLSPFVTSEASACDPSGWSLGGNAGECLEQGWKDDGLFIKNVCAEPIEVSVVDCTGSCPQDMALAPDEEQPLVLPKEPAHEDGFRLVSNMDDSITFTYLHNECRSEEGCSLGGAGTSSGSWLSALVVAGWLARRQQRARG